jgi:DNA-binding protein YbaB
MGQHNEQSDITDALAKALELTDEAKQAQAGAAGQSVEVEVAEGQVRVAASLAGEVTVRIIDPRAVRLGAEILSEEITRGVNEALGAAREQAGVPAAVDLEALSEKVQELQQQSVQRLTSFMSSLSDAHSKIVQSSFGDKGPQS